eukprot:757130-Pelagomonas_calceolata.AAC.4
MASLLHERQQGNVTLLTRLQGLQFRIEPQEVTEYDHFQHSALHLMAASKTYFNIHPLLAACISLAL